MDLLLGITDENMALFQWGVVIGASLVAALGDLRERRIPNALTFPLFTVGLIWAGWFGGWAGVGDGLLGCLLLGVPYVFLFLFAGGGAGDAKLMGAIGTWLGFKQSVVVLLCVAVIGGVIGLVKAVLQRRFKFVLTNVLISLYSFVVCVAGGRRLKVAGDQAGTGSSDELEMPYGVAIFTGVLVASVVIWKWGVDWLW